MAHKSKHIIETLDREIDKTTPKWPNHLAIVFWLAVILLVGFINAYGGRIIDMIAGLA